MLDLFPSDAHDPGGKTRIRVAADVVSDAVFSPCRRYRYTLVRTWDAARPKALWLMMNPSTADVFVDDPTVAKCGRLARRWGYGGYMVGNIHAYRCTDQTRLAEVDDPFGPDNRRHLIAMAKRAAMVVVGYGTPRIVALRSRGPMVARELVAAGVKLHVLKLSKAGVPQHPLYIAETTEPQPWEPPNAG